MTGVLLLAVGAASASEEFEGFRFYLGDLHVHTGASGDGGSSDIGSCAQPGECGALADVRDIARANGLDFVASTDHVNGPVAMEEAGWESVKQAWLGDDEGEAELVTILGAETWFSIDGVGPLGHKTLLLFGDDATLAGLALSEVQPTGERDIKLAKCDDIWTWMSALDATAGPALLIPHHPALVMPMANDWSCHDDQWEVAVELYSRHGSSEADGTPFDPPWSGTDPTGTVAYALGDGGAGLTLGFVGGTDSHDTEPGAVCELDVEHTAHPYGGGLTIAVMDVGATFDRSAIHDAIRARHTYVTSGPLVPAVLDWSSEGERIGGMGDQAVLTEGDPLTGEIRVPAEWEPFVLSAQLVSAVSTRPMTHVGAGAWRIELAADEVPPWGYVTLTLDGGAYYGAGTCEDGGADDLERIWLSPTWFDQQPPPEPDTDTGEMPDPVDTDDLLPVDTGDLPSPDTDEPPAPQADGPVVVDLRGGCGCASSGGVSAAWLVALILLLPWGRRPAGLSG
jgi:MYXO-CTERM domain-containing protein